MNTVEEKLDQIFQDCESEWMHKISSAKHLQEFWWEAYADIKSRLNEIDSKDKAIDFLYEITKMYYRGD